MSSGRKRVHGVEAAGAGDAGMIDNGVLIGPCPSCGAELKVAFALHPISKQHDRAILHPVPFCSYFGETDPRTIERDVQKG